MRQVIVGSRAGSPFSELSALGEVSCRAGAHLLLKRQCKAAACAGFGAVGTLCPCSPGFAVNLSGEQHLLRALRAIAFEAALALALERSGSVRADGVDVAACCVTRALVDVFAGCAKAGIAAATDASEGAVGVCANGMRVAVVAACCALIDVNAGSFAHLVAWVACASVVVPCRLAGGVGTAGSGVADADCLLASLAVSLVSLHAFAGVAAVCICADCVLAASMHASLALVNVHTVLSCSLVAVLALALVGTLCVLTEASLVAVCSSRRALVDVCTHKSKTETRKLVHSL